MRSIGTRESGLSSRALLVTTSWDDGHPSDLRVADLLDKHGLSATFYVPCANSEGRPVMVSSDVAELGRRFEIGGHTRDHVSLANVTTHFAADQILAIPTLVRRSPKPTRRIIGDLADTNRVLVSLGVPTLNAKRPEPE